MILLISVYAGAASAGDPHPDLRDALAPLANPGRPLVVTPGAGGYKPGDRMADGENRKIDPNSSEYHKAWVQLRDANLQLGSYAQIVNADSTTRCKDAFFLRDRFLQLGNEMKAHRPNPEIPHDEVFNKFEPISKTVGNADICNNAYGSLLGMITEREKEVTAVRTILQANFKPSASAAEILVNEINTRKLDFYECKPLHYIEYEHAAHTMEASDQKTTASGGTKPRTSCYQDGAEERLMYRCFTLQGLNNYSAAYMAMEKAVEHEFEELEKAKQEFQKASMMKDGSGRCSTVNQAPPK